MDKDQKKDQKIEEKYQKLLKAYQEAKERWINYAMRSGGFTYKQAEFLFNEIQYKETFDYFDM